MIIARGNWSADGPFGAFRGDDRCMGLALFINERQDRVESAIGDRGKTVSPANVDKPVAEGLDAVHAAFVSGARQS